MSAKLTLVYEVHYPQIGTATEHATRIQVVKEFPSFEVTTPDILAAFEALLQAAGFHCPNDSLEIVDESHQ